MSNSNPPSERWSRVSGGATDVSGRSALILDDEINVREIFAMALEDLGMVVAQAGTVAEGLPLVVSARPEVVLTDWQMPGATGRVMVEHLLTIPVERRPAILVVSGNLAHEDHRWLAVVPGVVILDKPISLGELQMSVQRALARRALVVTSGRKTGPGFP